MLEVTRLQRNAQTQLSLSLPNQLSHIPAKDPGGRLCFWQAALLSTIPMERSPRHLNSDIAPYMAMYYFTRVWERPRWGLEGALLGPNTVTF